MNTHEHSQIDAELDFKERCEFCDEGLEFRDRWLVRRFGGGHWTLCKNCYETFQYDGREC